MIVSHSPRVQTNLDEFESLEEFGFECELDPVQVEDPGWDLDLV